MPEDILVIRGGILDDLPKAFDRIAKDYEKYRATESRFGYGISVASGRPKAAEDRDRYIARLVTEGELRNNQMRVVTKEVLDRAGFPLIYDPPPPGHYVVDLGTDNPYARLEQFDALLGENEVNPCPFEK